jgi:hypothetical protein
MTAFLRRKNRESVKDRQETETNIKGDVTANPYGDILLVKRADVPRMATVVYGGIDTESPDALGTPSDIENMLSITFETKIRPLLHLLSVTEKADCVPEVSGQNAAGPAEIISQKKRKNEKADGEDAHIEKKSRVGVDTDS